MKEILSEGGNYLIFNKAIANKVGVDAAVLLGELCGEYDYYKQANMLEAGYFYSTVENLYKNLGLKKYKQGKALKVLEEVGFVFEKLKGVPPKRYFCINQKEIREFLLGLNNEPLNVQEVDNINGRKTDNCMVDNQTQINNRLKNNNTINKKVNNKDTKTLYQEFCHTLFNIPNLKDLDKETKESEMYLDDYTKNIVLNLRKVVYDRYKGLDEEKILLIYKWLLTIFHTGRGIKKEELILRLERLDNLERNVQINNLQKCIIYGYHTIDIAHEINNGVSEIEKNIMISC